jgi:hypothetical protein
MPYRNDRVNRLSFRLGLVAVSFVSALAGAEPGGDAPPADDTGSAATAPAPDAGGDAKAAPPADAKPDTVAAAAATPDAPARPLGDTGGRQSAFSWEPFGYLRLQYIVVQNDPNVAFVGRDDGFELQNARLGVHGEYRDLVRYVISIDGAVDERAQQNSPDGRLRVGLRDAFADVVVSGANLFVRGGFFQTWADPSRLVADIAREFVDRPIESRGMRSTEGWYTPGLPPGRSIGAALRLEPIRPGQVGFEIGVQNGADEFSSNNDNDLPAVNLSAMLRLAEDGFIVLGGRWNARTVGDLPFRQDETDLQGSLGVQLNAGALRFGGGGIFQRTSFESTGGPAQTAYGAHAQLAFKIPASAPVYAGYRFGVLDPSSLIVTDRVMEHTLGVAVGVPSLRMRVQIQATHVMEQAERQLSNTRVQLAGEVVL